MADHPTAPKRFVRFLRAYALWIVAVAAPAFVLGVFWQLYFGTCV